MKKLFLPLVALLLCLCTGLRAGAAGWPANYQGVMLQGFYWDSFQDTKWTTLEANADEYSKYFSLIWVPNSASCQNPQGMGYMPIWWFTNHNSAFGTEAQIRKMIKTYKAKGVGIIEDVVINHRCGKSNWTDFPSETWNGTTWHIGTDGICCNDEVAGQAGQAKPTGNYDTGQNFDGARDLDHTNANVQNNCKNYCKFLLEDMGYAGFRLDMVAGYGGQYTKIYNQYSNPTYCVGEYWDGNYDTVARWIEATGKTSAAFDFPGKYAINEAFHGNDMSKLAWKANGTTNQPAGLIHYAYAQYAVTFVDNHDTYRDGSKFNGNVAAANAFILCSPGTPCIFLPHYKSNKAAIQTLINVRNSVGVHNMSAVTVQRADRDCYMAEVTGKNGKLVVKIGSAQVTPAGYTNADIKASGNGYCVWTKTNIQGGNQGGGDDPVIGTAPAQLYLLGNIKGAQWSTSASPKMTKSGNKFTISTTFEPAAGETRCYFSMADALGADWDELNANANRYGASTEGHAIAAGGSAPITTYANNVDASACLSWTVSPGTYTITADFDKMTVSVSGGGTITDPDPTPGDYTIYYDDSASKFGTVNIHHWSSPQTAWPGVAMTKVKDNVWKYTFAANPSTLQGFLFCNAAGTDQTADYAGAPTPGHIYKGTGNKGAVTDGGVYSQGGDVTVEMPDQLYIVGNLCDWKPDQALEMTRSGNTFVLDNVNLKAAAESTDSYFSFITVPGVDWDTTNGGHRYGADSPDAPIVPGTAAALKMYPEGISASSAASWKAPAGTYRVVADFKANTVTITTTSGVELDTPDTPAEYYTLQGIRVDNPTRGLYIVRRGNKVTKVMVKD